MNWKISAEGTKNAEIFLYDVIDDIHDEYYNVTNAKHFINEIKALGDVDNITLRINSIGGDVYQGLAMYSYLKSCNTDINVIIDGIAASSASIVAMAGNKISMPENALLMIHNPYSSCIGNVNDMRTMAEALARMQDCFASVYQDKTGLDKEYIIGLMDNETWMTAKEAKEMHFCDEVISAVQIVACAKGKDKIILSTGKFSACIDKEITPKNLEIKEQKNTMEEIKSVAELEKAYPDLVSAIRAGAKKDECARIKELDEMLTGVAGADAIIEKAKYEEPRAASGVAFDVIKALKAQSVLDLQNRRDDSKSIEAAVIPTVENHDDFNAKVDAVASEINKIRGVK